ncbi:hypothetical protein DWW14_22535 [Bacteroides uniformis]|uniref:Uncharacterized protein n=1 Tax=Bacteroides uniformis TaxID=820 RepID=A0A412X231_BACUN|nr:hypothetical protein DWW14_22535 [Bacteroides uniformis]RGV84641.1 hypothetical protein DWV99_22695 [Bacteroides uniformis]
MKEYIYLTIFIIGLIWKISERISFERKKEQYDTKYISLYREHNTMLILIFLALCIDKCINVLFSPY